MRSGKNIERDMMIYKLTEEGYNLLRYADVVSVVDGSFNSLRRRLKEVRD